MADIQILVSRERACVGALSEAGSTWLRRNLVGGCSQPVRITAEAVPELVSEIEKDRLGVVVR